ncbi:protein of unknown function [Methylocaldum szegediense]|uniref:Uncharacterized protein n=1 Tax=Methylocaldum szegediense TaxID=73780 RepID=A0ABM9I1M2_9GAMM|nr:protein of unknown function [Methylocaldum szegediense]
MRVAAGVSSSRTSAPSDRELAWREIEGHRIAPGIDGGVNLDGQTTAAASIAWRATPLFAPAHYLMRPQEHAIDHGVVVVVDILGQRLNKDQT